MTFDQKIQALLQLGCRRFQLPTGVLTHLKGQTLTISAAYGGVQEFPIGASASVQDTLCQHTLDSDGPVAFERTDDIPYPTNTFAGNQNILTYIGTPLRMGQKVFGTFVFLSTAERKKSLQQGG